MAGGSETSLRPAGGPECGFPRPQKPATPSKKEQGAPRAGRGRSGTPKNEPCAPKRARGQVAAPLRGRRAERPGRKRHDKKSRPEPDTSRADPKSRTTTAGTPRQARAHATQRADQEAPKGGAPPGPDQHKLAYRQKRACPNAPAPPRRPDPTKPADRTKESAREPSFGAPSWAQCGFGTPSHRQPARRESSV